METAPMKLRRVNARVSAGLIALFFSIGLAGCGDQRDDTGARASETVVESAASAAAGTADGLESVGGERSADALRILIDSARRIPNSTRWFEILALPNDVYALWEPGHEERVNSFLIVGETKDVLYDTGMGIGDIGVAVAELRAMENLDGKPLMVINSHNHLDHNGGNGAFDEAWIIEDPWALAKLTQGMVGFEDYWRALREHPGIEPPPGFDPATFRIPAYPRERIRFLADGDIVDLGDRRFRVIHTTAHSPDGLALYDEVNEIFFGGDTFLGDHFLARDIARVEQALSRIIDLRIAWHYSSHGQQLIETMQDGRRLGIVRRMAAGEGSVGTTEFAGQTFPLHELEGVAITIAGDFLTY